MRSIFWIFTEIRKQNWMFGLSLILLAGEAGSSLATIGVQKWLIDDVILADRYDQLPLIIGVFVLAFVSYAVLFTVSPYVMQRNNISLYGSLQDRMLRTLQRTPIGEFRQQQSGKLVQNMTNDASKVADTVAVHIPKGLQSIITVVILTCIVGMVSPVLLLIVLMLSVGYYVIGKKLGQKSKQIFREVQDNKSELLAHIEEGISSTREVVAYHRRNWEVEKYNRLFEKYFQKVIAEGKHQNNVSFLSEPLKWGANLVVLSFGAYGVIQGNITLGVFVVTYQFAAQLVTGYQQAFDFVMNLFSRKAYFDRAKIILDLPKYDEGTQRIEGDLRTLTFEQVSFSYEEYGKQVLREVTMEFQIGKKIAIVGMSGSGKSTISQLLMRLYEPSEGMIKVNGEQLSQVSRTQWSNRISIVPQEPYFFPETIRANLLLGQNELSDAQVKLSCEIARIDNVIRDLPDGIDTVIGERGISLSGGQRQRLAIARAVLRDPDILILDEATSALDVETERHVQQMLDEHRKGKTTIFIAHRLSTIENADLIYVLEDGRVVETGTHEELMQGHSVYKRLFTAQALSAQT